jgi:CRISPR-associated protein Csb1
VLVDSVQSQANRLEEALLAALRQGVITMPHVSVDFRGAGLAGITEITSLDAPHRVYETTTTVGTQTVTLIKTVTVTETTTPFTLLESDPAPTRLAMMIDSMGLMKS